MSTNTQPNALRWIACMLALWAFCPNASGADWPTYRADSYRSATTAEELPATLALHWTYRSRFAPTPAWSGRDTRMPLDSVHHPVVAGGVLCFGSSADCKVYALDAATGAERWTFFTGSPVRFAPVMWQDRVLVASDDGILYCLSASTGVLLWQLRGGPADDMLLGNDRMISRWPIRGAPVVLGDTLYFAAGLWPSEGVYVYAVNPGNGAVCWVNDTAGTMMTRDAYAGSAMRIGISAQGYMAACGTTVFVTTGRAGPAAFDRGSGRFLYFTRPSNWQGGSDIMLSGERYYNGKYAYVIATGDSAYYARWNNGLATATTVCDTNMAYSNATSSVRVFDLTAGAPFDGTQSRSFAVPYRAVALARAGSTLVSAGSGSGGNGVCVAEIATGTVRWSSAVAGRPYGLAVAGQRLYVSTDSGFVYCFGAVTGNTPAVVTPAASSTPYGANEPYESAAAEIVSTAGVSEGYCLDLGCGNGALSFALAKRTTLRIYAVDSDPANVALARARLDSAGLYGGRVTVHLGDPSSSHYPDYFANLVVCGRSVVDGGQALSATEADRAMRPYGGKCVAGRPGSMAVTTRGALPQAGQWTHQYASPAATGCSDDSIVGGPLAMLWFTDFGLRMASRHGRSPIPLFRNGIMVVEGLNGPMAVDAYNGRRLWEYPLSGILAPFDQDHLIGSGWTNSNMCIDGDFLYIRHDSTCERIILATGLKDREYTIPGTWGFLACENGTLFGSVANDSHIVMYAYGSSSQDMSKLLTESAELFALSASSGARLWTYTAANSIRHNAIAIGGGRVYLIDRPLDDGDRLVPTGTQAAGDSVLLCLDAATGDTVWRDTQNIGGTMLALSTKHDVLLMGYTVSVRDYHLASERRNRLTGLRASDGVRLWDNTDTYYSRPLINGGTVYNDPYGHSLLTGARTVTMPSYRTNCANVSASASLLLSRSGALGYVDLLDNTGGKLYAGAKPACWINAIPAGGMVLMPDATDGCACSYPIKASMALQKRRSEPPLSVAPPAASMPAPPIAAVPAQPAAHGNENARDAFALPPQSGTPDRGRRPAGAAGFAARSMRWGCETPCLPVAAVRASSVTGRNRALNTVDGDLRSRWAGDEQASQWLLYDLGAETEVCGVTVVWYRAASSQAELVVEISQDGRRFRTVDRAGIAGRGTNTTMRTFVPEKARFARITLQAARGPMTTSVYEVGIHEAAGAAAFTGR